MSEPPVGTAAAHQAGSAAGRLRRAWRALPHERRLAAGAALGLFLTLFLPWYQETVIASGTTTNLRSASASLTGWGAFSFVEAAVLLVAAGVLVLLFIRAEGRAFHVPGGDGGVISAAGFWTSVLIVWRMFDKEGTTGHGQYATTAGIEWGIFIALGVAALLAYAGSRIRLAHEPEPPLPGERPAPRRGAVPASAAAGAGSAPPAPSAGSAPPAPSAGPAPPAGAATRRRGPIPPPVAANDPGAERGRPDDQARPRPRRATPDQDTRPRRPHADPDRPSSRGLNFDELEQIKFDDPPEPPTIRRAASTEDPLTIRLDRPD